MTATNTAVRDLYCSKCANRYDIKTVQGLCACGAPLLVDYDYQKAAKTLTPEALKTRPGSMWRYREVLPVFDEDNIVTLGEGMTPLLPSKAIGRSLGLSNLFFKDETVNPTGSWRSPKPKSWASTA